MRYGTLRGIALGLAIVALGVAPAGAGDDEGKNVITVGPKGCDHTTIQAALDAAPPEARITVQSGTYTGPFVIRKPVTLVGAGWQKTRLHMAYTEPPKKGAHPLPVLHVKDVAWWVHLEGLRLGASASKEPRAAAGTVLAIDNSSVEVEDCAIVPAPANGVTINGEADVKMRDCLVAAAQGVGIAIGNRGAGLPKVRIDDCDVRYGRVRCITIGPSCNNVKIEGCRISGSGWHGIRYDHASPWIYNNRFTDNVRFGIYASGRTAAHIEGNLFADSGMAGVSCWHMNGDHIANNTFVRNKRAGLEILGESAPSVIKNVFVENGAGIRWNSIAGRRTEASPGLGTVEENVFWKTGTIASNPLPEKARNRTADPGLGEDDVIASNFKWEKIGATDLPPAKSPFPLQPEEAEAAREYQTLLTKYGPRRAEPAPKQDPDAPDPRKAHKSARAWRGYLKPNAKLAVRREILGDIHAALAGDDPTERLAALYVAGWLTHLRYDRDAMRAAVLPFATHTDPITRRAAREALVRVKVDPAVDLPMWEEEVRGATKRNVEGIASALVALGEGKIEGRVADMVLQLLRDGTEFNRAFIIRSLQPTRALEPRVLDRLIELVRAAGPRDSLPRQFFQGFLIRIDPKPDRLVDFTLEAATTNPKEIETILNGLRQGLSDPQRARVAERLLAFVQDTKADDAYRMRVLLEALWHYVDPSHIERLGALAARESMTPASKHLVDRAIQNAKRYNERKARREAQRPGPDKPDRGLAYRIRSDWKEDIESGDDKLRDAAWKQLLWALSGDKPTERFAALNYLAWLPEDANVDRTDLRARILPHAASEDSQTRFAARNALVRVKPEPAVDLPLWIDATKRHAYGHNGEQTAKNLVVLSEGKVEGAVAEAVLTLLSEEAPTMKSGVIRGLTETKVFDPRVAARMIEVVRAAKWGSYDCLYYFVFIAPKLDPKPDEVLDLMLDLVERGKGYYQTYLKPLPIGLSDDQRKHAAQRLLAFAETTDAKGALLGVLPALAHVADTSHVQRLEALSGRTEDPRVLEQLAKTVKAARTR